MCDFSHQQPRCLHILTCLLTAFALKVTDCTGDYVRYGDNVPFLGQNQNLKFKDPKITIFGLLLNVKFFHQKMAISLDMLTCE